MRVSAASGGGVEPPGGARRTLPNGSAPNRERNTNQSHDAKGRSLLEPELLLALFGSRIRFARFVDDGEFLGAFGVDGRPLAHFVR